MPHSMTYNQLVETIQTLPKECLHDIVTVFDPNKNEHIAVVEIKILDARILDLHPKTRCYNTSLEAGHPCLVLKV